MSDMIRMSKHQTLVIVSSTPAALVVESTWTARQQKPPPRHFHPRQDELFDVLEGELTVELGQEPPRVLRAGDTLDVPRGTVHRMWNPSSGRTRARWRVTPRLRTEEMFRYIHNGTSPLRTIAMLRIYRNEFHLPTPFTRNSNPT